MLVLILIFVPILIILTKKYLRTVTELRRLTQLSYSPMISNVGELIQGITTIRVYERVDYMDNIFFPNITKGVKSDVHERLSGAWLILRLEVVVAISIWATALLVCGSKFTDKLNTTQDESKFGLTLTWMMNLGNIMSITMFFFTECCKQMSSVERLFEYIDNKSFERDWVEPKAPEDWPKSGDIQAENIIVRYRDGLPLVLKGLDFKIPAGKKCGIVGRTGSGKSS